MKYNKFELMAIYDTRQSFYGKAIVTECENKKELFSYGVLVAECIGGVVSLMGHYSQTTSRHQKEFCKQFDTTGRQWEEIKKESEEKQDEK